jgi:hypothetical protein
MVIGFSCPVPFFIFMKAGRIPFDNLVLGATKSRGFDNFYYLLERFIGFSGFSCLAPFHVSNANVKSAIDDETYRHELMRDFKLPTGEIMLGRIRHFSQGMVIGSKQFIKEAYVKFGGEIISKKDRNVYQTGIINNILSLRKLIC